jgi:hypothetical protein
MTTPRSGANPGRCRPGWRRRLTVPALVMAGDASLPFMPDAAGVLSQAIPQGQLRMLQGQPHEVNPAVLAPVLLEFFTSCGGVVLAALSPDGAVVVVNWFRAGRRTSREHWPSAMGEPPEWG